MPFRWQAIVKGRIMKKTIFAAATAAMTLATVASAETYKCQFKDGAGGGYIGSVVLVKLDFDKKQAWVRHNVTEAQKKGWHAANFGKDNSKRTTIDWEVHFQNSRKQSATLLYKLNIRKNNLKASATMLPSGYDNIFTESGKCSPL